MLEKNRRRENRSEFENWTKVDYVYIVLKIAVTMSIHCHHPRPQNKYIHTKISLTATSLHSKIQLPLPSLQPLESVDRI